MTENSIKIGNTDDMTLQTAVWMVSDTYFREFYESGSAIGIKPCDYYVTFMNDHMLGWTNQEIRKVIGR